MKLHSYYVYILTNKNRTVLYIGVTNDLERRLHEHISGYIKGFTHKYSCHHLVYYECFSDISEAIAREKRLKGWSRLKKDALIGSINPSWEFLNKDSIILT
jgi:putative endonuclease